MINCNINERRNEHGFVLEKLVTVSFDTKDDWDNFVLEYTDNDDGTKNIKIGINLYNELIYLSPSCPQIIRNITTADNKPFDGSVLVGVQYIELDCVKVVKAND